MKKQCIPAWFLAFFLALLCLPAGTALAEGSAEQPLISSLYGDVSGEVVESGSCGPNLSYQVVKTGSFWGNPRYALVFTGSGAMNDYQKETAPWRHLGNANFYSIEFSEGITHIGDYAFNYFYNVGEVKLPQSLVSIGQYAFQNCMELDLADGIRFPYGLKDIGSYAFAGCSALSGGLSLPDSITSIGEGAFSGCTGLSGTLHLPGGLKSIPKSAFNRCSGLSGTLTLPHGLTSIGDNAFYECSGFTGRLVLPDGLAYLGNSAFGDCTGLSGALSIPKSLSRIGTNCFYNCSSLSGTLSIPSSITVIGSGAFAKCTGIIEVHFEGAMPEFEYQKYDWRAFEDMTVEGFYPSSWTTKPEESFQGGTFHWHHPGSSSKDPNPNTPQKPAAKTLKVTFNKNASSATLSQKTKTVTKGRTYGSLPKPKRKGYSFQGWYTKKSGGKKVTASTKVTSTKNHTLYARWKKSTYKITYKVNGGTVNKKGKTTYTVTSQFTLPTPKRSGFKFLGWYDKSGKKLTRIKKGSTGNKTLTAKWKRPTYKITYKLNGGKNNPANPSTFTASKSVTLKKPSRTGYTFLGWYNSSGKKVTKIPKGTKKNQKLTAKWKANTYKIRFHKNGATAGSMSTVSCTYGKSVKLPSNRYSYGSYPFLGWSLSPDREPTYKNRASVRNLTSKKGGTVTLYAIWDLGKYPKIQYTIPSPAFYQYDRYYNGENRIGDCAIASVAILRTMKNNGKSASQNYEEVWAANGRQSYVNSWAALGLQLDSNVSLENIYQKLKSGPVICHRQGKGTHFSVIYAYVGNKEVLDKSGFLVYDVKDVVNQQHLAGNLAKWDNYNSEGSLVKIVY